MSKRLALWPGIVSVVLLLSCVPYIWAGDIPLISTNDLKAKIDAKENFLLINALSDIEFGMEHIPGSVNIPVGEIKTTDKLPVNKETPIVFY
jgi:rhodanese-related sulfurtransferase